MGEVLSRSDAAQQAECAEERSVLVRSGNDHERTPVPHGPLEPESMRSKVRGNLQFRKSGADFVERTDNSLAGARGRRVSHASNAALELLHG